MFSFDPPPGGDAQSHPNLSSLPAAVDRTVRRRRSHSEPSSNLALSLEAQMRVLEGLRANLAVHHETLEDPDLMLILADGQTSLLEFLDALLEADLVDEGLIDGLKRSKDTLSVRLSRLEERRASRRAILEQALFLLDRKSLERPTGTLTLAERPTSLIIEEEAQIPARFFDLKPVLNRRLAKEALEAGEDVPGARLAVGQITLTLRRR